MLFALQRRMRRMLYGSVAGMWPTLPQGRCGRIWWVYCIPVSRNHRRYSLDDRLVECEMDGGWEM